MDPLNDQSKLMQFHHFMHKLVRRRWRIGRALALHAEDLGSIPGRDKPKSLKQVVTAPLPTARQ